MYTSGPADILHLRDHWLVSVFSYAFSFYKICKPKASIYIGYEPCLCYLKINLATNKKKIRIKINVNMCLEDRIVGPKDKRVKGKSLHVGFFDMLVMSREGSLS